MKISNFVRPIFYLLLAVAPLGTRYIFKMGTIAGVEVEPGTLSLFGTQILVLALILSGIVWPVRRNIKLSYLNWIVSVGAGLLFLVAEISAVLNGQARHSVVSWWLLLGLGLILIIQRIQPTITGIFWALAGGGFFQSLLAIEQFFTQAVTANKWLGMAAHLPEVAGTFVIETNTGRWLRAYGTLPHPNMLGLYLVFAIVASLILILREQNKIRPLAVLFLLLNTSGFFLAFSRSAWLALIGSLIFLVIVLFVQKQTKILRQSLVAMGIIFVILLQLSYFLAEPFSTRILGRGRLEKISIESRVDQLFDVQMLVRDNWLFGAGPGLMPLVLHEKDQSRLPWDYQYVHNVPLLVFVELGVLGLLPWLLIVGLVLKLIRNLLRAPTAPEHLVLGAMFIGLLISALFDHFVWSFWVGQLWFWLVVGLLMFFTPPEFFQKTLGKRAAKA
jgi:O-antigen ligase